MACSPALRVVALSLPLGPRPPPPQPHPQPPQPYPTPPRSTTTANTHRTAESSSILQMNPRCHGEFARAACRRSVLATWTLIHPPGTHPDPQDPRQPQSLSTLRKPRQISKRTFDAMACSPAQRVVALSQSLGPRFETMPRANPGSAVTSI